MTPIFLNGGIGDFLATQEFIPEDTGQVIYGCMRHAAIDQIFKALPNYKHYKPEVWWDDWHLIPNFYWPGQMMPYIGAKKEDWEGTVQDWSVFKRFNAWDKGELERVSQSYLEVKLAELPAGLPESYCLVCPYSKSIPSRYFDSGDWAECLAFLDKMQLPGLVLNDFAGYVPQDPRLIDWSQKTTICEAIEIAKHCSAYAGVDSCLANVACRICHADYLRIVSRNHDYYQWAELFCYPHPLKETKQFIQWRLKA